MIKKNGELQQADEYNAIDVLHPNLSIRTPPNQEKVFNEDENASPAFNDEFFGDSDANLLQLRMVKDQGADILQQLFQ